MYLCSEKECKKKMSEVDRLSSLEKLEKMLERCEKCGEWIIKEGCYQKTYDAVSLKYVTEWTKSKYKKEE